MDYSDGFDSYSAAALGGQGSWVNTSFTGLYVYKPASDGEVYPNASGARCCAYYNGTIENEQYSKCTVAAIGHTSSIGVAVRCSSNSFYGWYSNDVGSLLGKMVSGTWTTLATGDPFSIGENRTLEIVGSTLKCYRNSVLDTSINGTGMIGDSSISSGYVGICGFGANNSSRIDIWEGGGLNEKVLEYYDSDLYDNTITDLEISPNEWHLFSPAYYKINKDLTLQGFVLTGINLWAKRGSTGSAALKIEICIGFNGTSVGTVASTTTVNTTTWSTSYEWHYITLSTPVVFPTIQSTDPVFEYGGYTYKSYYFNYINVYSTDSGSIYIGKASSLRLDGTSSSSEIWGDLLSRPGSILGQTINMHIGARAKAELWGYLVDAGLQLPARYKEFSKI